MRTKGYHCKVYHTLDCILMEKEYSNLREIAKDLNVNYQFIADVSSRKIKRNFQQFKFYPQIEINKL